MAQNNAPELDLETVLRTLANLVPAPAAPPNQQAQGIPATIPPVQAHQPQSHTPDPAIAPGQPATSNAENRSQDPRRNGALALQQRAPPTQPPQSAPTTLMDASTITEWPKGLRHVHALSMRNPNFAPAVQKLIKIQEHHVEQWHAGRQRLIEEQATKKQNELKLRASITFTGILADSGPLRTTELERQELERYDKKVHKCLRELTQSQSSELKRLGVPFFGVREDLIIDSASESSDSANRSPAPNGHGSDEKITKQQLRDLQRKMLGYLEDMYKE